MHLRHLSPELIGGTAMRTKSFLFAMTTVFVATSVQAGPGSGNATFNIKSKEQIRCELLADCKPLPSTRAWITRTGGLETDKTKIIRAQQANLAPAKPQIQVRATAKRSPQAAPMITAVKSSDLFINFTSASFDIDDAAFEQASELYAALTAKEWSSHRFEISGHTDAVGSSPYNNDLSQKRAQAVVDLLAARGVARSQLLVKGYGFRHPIAGLEPNDGRNRRVEIKKLD